MNASNSFVQPQSQIEQPQLSQESQQPEELSTKDTNVSNIQKSKDNNDNNTSVGSDNEVDTSGITEESEWTDPRDRADKSILGGTYCLDDFTGLDLYSTRLRNSTFLSSQLFITMGFRCNGNLAGFRYSFKSSSKNIIEVKSLQKNGTFPSYYCVGSKGIKPMGWERGISKNTDGKARQIYELDFWSMTPSMICTC